MPFTKMCSTNGRAIIARCIFGVISMLAAAAPALAADALPPSAETVIGQVAFSSNTQNCSSQGMALPSGATIDTRRSWLFVADSGNNRILWWTTMEFMPVGRQATNVIGQEDFISYGANRGRPTSYNSLSNPTGMIADEQSNLWVADTGNNRVLCFHQPGDFPDGLPGGYDPASGINDRVADVVIGQPDFISNGANCNGTPTAATLNSPKGLAFDNARGNLWIADTENNRVLCYQIWNTTCTPKLVLGQKDFTSNYINGTPTGEVENWTLNRPVSVTIDRSIPDSEVIWVSDSGNHRVLKFDLSQSTVTAVDVIGQANFVNHLKNRSRNNDIASNDGLNSPQSITMLGLTAQLWVCDQDNHRVLCYDAHTKQPYFVLGQTDFTTNTLLATSTGTFHFPKGIIDDGDNLWIADTVNNRVVQYKGHSIDPRVLHIEPASGLQNTVVTVRFSNSGIFEQKYNIKKIRLRRQGERDIIGGTPQQREAEAFVCDINLGDNTPGKWDIVYEYGMSSINGLLSKTFEDSFTILSPLPPIKLYPNPFNPYVHTSGMTLQGTASFGHTKIFDENGRLVRDILEKAGGHVVKWDGRNEQGEIVPSGVYVVIIDRWHSTAKVKISVEK